MTKPSFTSQISLGNIIQIGIIIAGLAAGYATFDARSEANNKAIVDIITDIDGFENRIRSLEQGAARSDERMSSILTLLGRIDSRLERIERRGNP